MRHLLTKKCFSESSTERMYKTQDRKVMKWSFTVQRSASAFPLRDAHNLLKRK